MTLSPEHCRVVVDPAQEGALNMAIDQVLLESGLAGTATLRFYQWIQPTVSLGHFQSVQASAVPARFSGLPVVKRLSGGGALLHDRELTYSCVLPKTHPLTREPGRLYDLVHECIISELKKLGASSRMRGADAFADQSFLCFSRGDARDVVIGNQKIVGSAQRRRQGAVLQHGSLLIARSSWAEEFPGVSELTGVELKVEELIPGLTAEISQRLELTPVWESLSPTEQAAAKSVAQLS